MIGTIDQNRVRGELHSATNLRRSSDAFNEGISPKEALNGGVPGRTALSATRIS